MARRESGTSNGGGAAHAEHRITGVHYVLTWAALLVLTVVTFLASQALSGAWEELVALLIATIKASLVIVIFMHMLEQRFANRLVLAVALFFVLLLLGLVVLEVNTRTPVEAIQPILG